LTALLVEKKPPRPEVVWIDPPSAARTDARVETPSNVTLVHGGSRPANPVLDWIARERHYYSTVRQSGIDAALFSNAWGTLRARRWLRRQGIPLVFDYSDLMHEFRPNAAERFISRKAVIEALRTSDLVVTTAQRIYEDARQFNPNTVLIPNGVDVAQFRKARPVKLKHPAVGFAGGWGEWVDFEPLLRAAQKLPKVNFYLIGDGVQRPFVERFLREHRLANVRLSKGFVPHVEIKNWMAAFDVCVIPFKVNKLTDAVCPIKLFEYWALEKPAILSPAYEMKRIAGRNALFARTADEWVVALSRLLGDAKLRRELGRKGYKLASSRYDWNVLADKYTSSIGELIAAKAR